MNAVLITAAVITYGAHGFATARKYYTWQMGRKDLACYSDNLETMADAIAMYIVIFLFWTFYLPRPRGL